MTVDEALKASAPVVAEYKIGTNKGKPRIWIDGKRLAAAGFIGGTHYFYDVAEGCIVCGLTEHAVRDALGTDPDPMRTRKVTGRPGGKPIIDMLGSDVAAAFPGGTRVRVTFEPGLLIIEAA